MNIILIPFMVFFMAYIMGHDYFSKQAKTLTVSASAILTIIIICVWVF